jgi:hypothetical protein
MRYDPWWTYYAAGGYVAAGGRVDAYRPTVRALEASADADGLIQVATTPVASAQTVYFGALAMIAAGLDPSSVLTPNAVVAMRGNEKWSEGDIAMWGETLYLLGREPGAAMSAEIRAAAQSCANVAPSAGDVRSVNVCRQAASHFGVPLAHQPPVAVGDLQSEAVVDVAANWPVANAATVTKSVTQIVRSPEGVPTSVLAEAVDAARASGKPLTEAEREAVVSVIRRRRADPPFDALFAELPGAGSADLRATALALEVLGGRA